jgi:ubiquinone/menaquinone biosynthesis C-methylase UbiE
MVVVTSPSTGFDRLAGVYRLLEVAAFGHSLEQARFAHLDRLAACRRILVIGEGDGRCLERLLRVAPAAHVDVLDISPAMLARAASRLRPEDHTRVQLRQADVLRSPLPDGPYDAVTTMFVLDCFTATELRGLVPRIAAVLTPAATWLWADFRVPAGGVVRWYALACVGSLYAFFRWQTGISARVLPPAEQQIEEAGFRAALRHDTRGGLIRSVAFERHP